MQVWDVCSDQEAAELVAGLGAQEAAKVVVQYAVTHGSMDNITCMVVVLET